MSRAGAPIPGKRIKQRRGQKTYDALVKTAFKLLEKSEFEEITVAELSRAAGYSVGAFYARFRSKDELFDALIASHLQSRTSRQLELLHDIPDEELISELISDIVSYYWKRKRFWRAALKRSTRDHRFWDPMRKHGQNFGTLFSARISQMAGRELTKQEDTNIRFAFQVVFGVINNTIINRPGPLFMGHKVFVEHLTRSFQLVSDYDRLVGN